MNILIVMVICLLVYLSILIVLTLAGSDGENENKYRDNEDAQRPRKGIVKCPHCREAFLGSYPLVNCFDHLGLEEV